MLFNNIFLSSFYKYFLIKTKILLDMINNNILSMFKSNVDGPIFSILIKDIKQDKDCGEDSLQITVLQVDKSLNEIINNSENVVKRTLDIKGQLELDDQDLYRTKLIGYVSGENVVKKIDESNSPYNKTIEVLETNLEKEISIEFNKEYKKQPFIFINIDNYKNFYKKEAFSFDKYTKSEVINGKEVEQEYFTGVTITFEGLKRKQTYPVIGVVIIGDS